MPPKIQRIVFINRLQSKISNLKITFGLSTKSASFLSYIVDYRNVDIEREENIIRRKEINMDYVEPDQQVFSKEGDALEFQEEVRCYWQIYFKYEGRNYKIDKNNAMMNLIPALDDGCTLDIIVRRDGDKIRANMIVDSGQSYSYFQKY